MCVVFLYAIDKTKVKKLLNNSYDQLKLVTLNLEQSMFSSELQDFIKHRYTSQVCENEESEGSFENKDFDCYSSDIFSQGLHTTVIYALERIRIIAENSSLLDPNPISI